MEVLDRHEYEYESMGPKEWKKVIEYTKDDAAKIAYYRLSSEYGIKYDLKDLDWMKYVPPVDINEIEE